MNEEQDRLYNTLLGMPAEKVAKIRYLHVISEKGTAMDACLAASTNKTVVNKWIETDRVFQEELVNSKSDWSDVLEQELYKRALHGVPKPIIIAKTGEIKGWWMDKEATMRALEFANKGAQPGKYKDHLPSQDIKITIRDNERMLRQMGAKIPELTEGIVDAESFHVIDVLNEVEAEEKEKVLVDATARDTIQSDS